MVCPLCSEVISGKAYERYFAFEVGLPHGVEVELVGNWPRCLGEGVETGDVSSSEEYCGPIQQHQQGTQATWRYRSHGVSERVSKTDQARPAGASRLLV